MSTLSELSRTYLQYIDDIRAGERALAEDISRILDAVGQARKETATVVASALEWRRPLLEGSDLFLRLAWEAREGWPRLGLEARGENQALLDPGFLKTCALPALDLDALKDNPEEELGRVWDESLDIIGDWLCGEEAVRRVAALRALREVSRAVQKKLHPKPETFTQREGRISGKASNTHFPAYVEWCDQRPGWGRRVYWEVVYQPEHRADRPAGLHLVCFNGAYVPTLLEGLPRQGTYANHPLLLSWTEALAAAGDAPEAAEALGRRIVEETAKVYAAFRARAEGREA